MSGPVEENPSYYLPVGAGSAGERYRATPHTGGPWSAAHQHGGPPATLLARAIESRVLPTGFGISRFTMDLLGPVPVGEVAVSAEVLRAGRAVHLAAATLTDVATGRACAQARAWAVPVAPGPVVNDVPPATTPEDGRTYAAPPGWVRGYIDSVDWRWVVGRVGEAGPGVVWMRPCTPLLPGEPLTSVQRILACVDSGSGISAELDIREWDFRNTDLTVHIVRPPEGEWLCIDGLTTIAGAGMGVARTTVSDARGVVAFSAQSLLVRRRQI